jgi:hypothetical protein
VTSTLTRLYALQAVADGRGTVTSAGFVLDGQAADEDVQRVMDLLWLEDLIDADLAGPRDAQPLILTDAGRQVLAKHASQAQR